MTKLQALLLSASFTAIATSASADYWHESAQAQDVAAANAYAASVSGGAAATNATQDPGTWTGGYMGLEFGAGASASADSYGYVTAGINYSAVGLYGGYLYDYGGGVVGGELAFDRLIYSGGESSLISLKGRWGYDGGTVLPYVSLGLANLQDVGASYSGGTAGIGIDFKVGTNVLLGAAYDYYGFAIEDQYGNPGTGALGTLALRVGYKF